MLFLPPTIQFFHSFSHHSLPYSHHSLPYSHHSLPYSHYSLPYSHHSPPYSHHSLPYSHHSLPYFHYSLPYFHHSLPYFTVDCDPHPGNLACDNVLGGRLIFYDFGTSLFYIPDLMIIQKLIFTPQYCSVLTIHDFSLYQE